MEKMYMDDKSRMLLKKGSRRSASRASRGLRLASLVKEQRARFYIMRRCVTMLMCCKD
jgi:hypothetical protein